MCGTAASGQALQQLRFVGTTSLSGRPANASGQGAGLEFRQGPEEEQGFLKNVTGRKSPARVPADHVPTAAGLQVSASSSGTGFAGLTHLDQRVAGSGAYLNTQFSSEPPDQCLAVGGGFVLEGVNSAFRVRSTSGAALTAVIPMNQFFGLAPGIIRSTPPVYGPFTSDPRCLFDAHTHRWFVTILVIGIDPGTGDFLPASSLLIAVSTTSNPAGTYNIFSIDTTNNTGTPEHAGCPCFGDQPLIGADQYGFYVTTNEFPITGPGFNGAQIYATSKAKLVAGSPGSVVHIAGPALAEDIAYSVQPATVPPGGAFATSNGGIEYFLSALDFTSTLDSRIAVWAMTNTISLDTTPNVVLQSAVLNSQVYGFPPAAQQKDGPLPLADVIGSVFGVKLGHQHLPLVESNDDRMQQTVYAAGLLWSSLSTAVKTANGPVRTGAAWFAVQPTWVGGQLGGSIRSQGYVSVNGNSVLFPAVGVSSIGKAVMGFTLIGPDFYPSAAYVTLGAGGAGDIKVVAAGVAPDDGLTGYPVVLGTNVGRWGDYSAAVADENGDIWFATEFIPNSPRTILANWGTFIARINP